MSPRADDVAVNDVAPVIMSKPTKNSKESSKGDGVSPPSHRRRKAKPLSSGWKSLAWTKPPPKSLRTSTPKVPAAPVHTAPVATSSLKQHHEPVSLPAPGSPETKHGYHQDKIGQAIGHKHSNSGTDSSSSSSSTQKSIPKEQSELPDENQQLQQQQQEEEQQQQRQQGQRELGTGETGPHKQHRHHGQSRRRQHHHQQNQTEQPANKRIEVSSSADRTSTRTGAKPIESKPKRRVVPKRNQFIPSARSEEFGSRNASPMDRLLRSPSHQQPVESTRPARRELDEESAVPDLDASSRSTPSTIERVASAPSNDVSSHPNVILERSFSDTSIVTASDFGAPKQHRPIILTEMKDEDAIAELGNLLAKGKGLPVVKHASGLGGGKSRKLLKFNEIEGWLALCSMRPPYFKTKIPITDIDRVDSKWCCVVVHSKGRSPLRLEVDSFASADILRVGLMAASRIEPTPPVEPPPSLSSVEDEVHPDPEQGLSSVRPGHQSHQVYDPDAALSVAALLAKEMEEERTASPSDVGPWTSSHNSSGDATKERPAHPVLKRSLSMTSVASKMTDHAVDAEEIINNRRSLPRNVGADKLTHGPPQDDPVSLIDTKAALRRLYGAVEGRGMVALKRNSTGKGRSRVMVRSRIKEGTIGWAHVLPPFSRKYIAVKDLVGASRSSRVVTVSFQGREPVLFETDRLTDALILEQGFLSLAKLQKTAKQV